MKRTFNINIGNTIIHIEEDAYEMLTVYLNEVKQHFARNADDFEIVTDIENRIAEMFAERLEAEQKQAIGIEDVLSVIGQMGSVKDFENSEEETEETFTAKPKFPPVKKLYRDTDQAMIAGVCVGLAHYLDIDSRWVRLAAIATIFVGGSGVLAYIILWIMIPRAETKTEKMAMKGEEPNLRGFVNSHLNPLVQHSRGFLAEFFTVIGNFISGTGRTIVKLIAGAIVVFGSVFLLCLIVLLAAFLGFWDANVYQLFPLSIVNEDYFSILTFAAFIVLAIPLLALILFSIRAAFNGKPMNKILSFGLLIVWLIGVTTSIFYVAKISSEFKESAEFTQISNIKPYRDYQLIVDRTRFFTKEDSLRYSIDARHYRGRKILNNLDDDFNMPRNIGLRIEKSDNGKTFISQNYSAKGKTFELALQNAQNIHYDLQQQDSLLNFSPMLQLTKKANWRDQEVELTLHVPIGTKLNISKEFNRYFTNYGFWDCDHDSESDFTQWIMTDTGLKCQHELADQNKE